MKKWIITIIIALVMIVLGIVLLVYSNNIPNVQVSENKPLDKSENIIDEKSKSWEVVEIPENKISKDLKMTIDQETVSRTGVVIIIEDPDDTNQSFSEWYRIDKFVNGEWKKVPGGQQFIIDLVSYVGESGVIKSRKDWSNDYGELENGKYRYVRETIADYYNKRYFYAEFTIDESTPITRTSNGFDIVENEKAKNIEMKIKEGTLTNTGVTVIITDTNNQPYNYDESYRIAKKENGQWKELEMKYTIEKYVNGAYELDENNSLELNFDWSKKYEALEKGEYRLQKSVYDDEHVGNKYFWVDFTID